MKVYIQTDIEGVAGFCFFENVKDSGMENTLHRERMRGLLTDEVNAAVTAAFESGASEVLVNDSHGSGYNILFENLDSRCEIIHGRNCSGAHWLPELDSSCDALILVGMHAMGGTEGALLPHSKWAVNGGEICLSEASMACALAGEQGIPAVFASGDQYITAELTEKIPGIVTAVVKKSLGAYVARSLMPARSCARIHDGVIRALKNLDRAVPYVIPGPLTLNLWDNAEHIPPFRPVLEKDVQGATLEEVFSKALRLFPWNRMDVTLPDGFIYP